MFLINSVVRHQAPCVLAAICMTAFSTACRAEQKVELHKGLSTEEIRCLRQLFSERSVNSIRETDIERFVTETVVGRVDLRGNGQHAFIFVVHDIGYCGSAGCMMLIGEHRRDAKCHLLDEGDGSGDAVTALRHRDHGYRRLYTPCELRFDGHQYRQLHEECPTLKVQH